MTETKRQRITLSERIHFNGHRMTACSHCVRLNVECIGNKWISNRCANCARMGRRCNAVPVEDAELHELLEARRQNRKEIDKTVAAIGNLSNTLRLLQQRESTLTERVSQFARRELQSSIEADAAVDVAIQEQSEVDVANVSSSEVSTEPFSLESLGEVQLNELLSSFLSSPDDEVPIQDDDGGIAEGGQGN